ESDLPVVFVDKSLGLDVDSVLTDEQAGARLSVRHLMVLGHREAGYVGYVPEAPDETIEERRESFIGTCVDMGLRCRPENVCALPCPPGRQPPPQAWTPALRAYLSGGGLPTAVACYNDTVAAALWKAAEGTGMRVPEDLSIIGFDNDFFEGCIERPLTTVDPRKRLIGACAGRRLAALIEGRHPQDGRQVRVRPHLVVRSSTAPPRTGRSPASQRRAVGAVSLK
ncbi:MAG: LacI family DNA-binding transcriptional regulator, partial [Planctomycetota bacterium]